MSSPTNVNFDDLNPQPKPDTFNIEWQGSTAVADPNSPDHQVREVSGCYRVPQVGGVLVLTDNYQVSVTDSGLLLIANSSSPLTFTMPAIIPSLKTGQGVWNVSIKNIGTGALTVDPNGLNLDGSASTVSLAQGAALLGISTDGTDYRSSGGNATPGGSTGNLQYNNAGAFGGFADGTSHQVLHGGRTFGSVDLASEVGSSILPVANGGTNTASPGLVAGSNVTISGTWPNQTVNATNSGGGGTIPGVDWYPYSVDAPPSSAGSLDDEFNAGSLDLGRWTWVNQGTSTATQSGSLLVLTPQIVGGADSLRMIVQNAPATPWTVVSKCALRIKGSTNSSAGMALYDGTKVITFAFSVSSGSPVLSVFRWTNTTTFSTTSLSLGVNFPSALLSFWYYLAITDNGTNLIYTLYIDGVQPLVLLTESRTAFMAGAPTKVGLFADLTNASETGWLVADYFRRTL